MAATVRSPFPAGSELLGEVWKDEWYAAHCYKIPAIAAMNSILQQVSACPTGAQIGDDSTTLGTLKAYHEQLGDLAGNAESAQKQVIFFLQSVQATSLQLQKQTGRKIASAERTASKFKKWFWKTKAGHHSLAEAMGEEGAPDLPRVSGQGRESLPPFDRDSDTPPQHASSSSEDDGAGGVPRARRSRRERRLLRPLPTSSSVPHSTPAPSHGRSAAASLYNSTNAVGHSTGSDGASASAGASVAHSGGSQGSGSGSGRWGASIVARTMGASSRGARSPANPVARARTEYHPAPGSSQSRKDYSLSAMEFERIMENLRNEDEARPADPSAPRLPPHDRERRSLGASDFGEMEEDLRGFEGGSAATPEPRRGGEFQSPIFGVSQSQLGPHSANLPLPAPQRFKSPARLFSRSASPAPLLGALSPKPYSDSPKPYSDSPQSQSQSAQAPHSQAHSPQTARRGFQPVLRRTRSQRTGPSSSSAHSLSLPARSANKPGSAQPPPPAHSHSMPPSLHPLRDPAPSRVPGPTVGSGPTVPNMPNTAPTAGCAPAEPSLAAPALAATGAATRAAEPAPVGPVPSPAAPGPATAAGRAAEESAEPLGEEGPPADAPAHPGPPRALVSAPSLAGLVGQSKGLVGQSMGLVGLSMGPEGRSMGLEGRSMSESTACVAPPAGLVGQSMFAVREFSESGQGSPPLAPPFGGIHSSSLETDDSLSSGRDSLASARDSLSYLPDSKAEAIRREDGKSRSTASRTIGATDSRADGEGDGSMGGDSRASEHRAETQGSTGAADLYGALGACTRGVQLEESEENERGVQGMVGTRDLVRPRTANLPLLEVTDSFTMTPTGTPTVTPLGLPPTVTTPGLPTGTPLASWGPARPSSASLAPIIVAGEVSPTVTPAGTPSVTPSTASGGSIGPFCTPGTDPRAENLTRASSARYHPSSPVYSVSLQPSPASNKGSLGYPPGTPTGSASTGGLTPDSAKMTQSLSRRHRKVSSGVHQGLALSQGDVRTSPAGSAPSLTSSPLGGPAPRMMKALTKSQTMQTVRGGALAGGALHHGYAGHGGAAGGVGTGRGAYGYAHQGGGSPLPPSAGGPRKSGHDRLLEILSGVHYTWASHGGTGSGGGSGGGTPRAHLHPGGPGGAPSLSKQHSRERGDHLSYGSSPGSSEGGGSMRGGFLGPDALDHTRAGPGHTAGGSQRSWHAGDVPLGDVSREGAPGAHSTGPGGTPSASGSVSASGGIGEGVGGGVGGGGGGVPGMRRLHSAKEMRSPAKKAQEDMLLELLRAAPPIKWSHVQKDGHSPK